jgi:cytidylate kinase
MISITLGGLPGTGTTTVAKLLCQTFQIPYVNTGDIFREMAREMGMELNVFGKYAAGNPGIDQELDRRQLELIRGGAILLEGRLSGYMAHLAGIPAFKVWIQADLLVCAGRVATREKISIEQALAGIKERALDEKKRYQTIYQIDIDDLSPYDLIIDSAQTSPAEIAALISREYHRHSPRSSQE